MNKNYLIIFILCIFSIHYSNVMANEKNRLFESGNRLYQEGKYFEAIQSYQKIIELKYHSGPLYYNIGNAYYKLQEVGRAILFYERARRLMPHNENLKANIALANLTVVDKFEQQPQFIFLRITEGLINLFSKQLLLSFVMVLYLLFVGSLIYWILSRNRFSLKAGQRISLIVGICFFIFMFLLIGRLLNERNNIEAIILVNKIDVMSAPVDKGGVEVFSLHEGTKVKLDQITGDWVEIILPDRKVGWVKKEVLEII
jgi:tetratricopeptide (TPR) repeat protein